jgi:DNA-binding transcriptional MerR regulator
MKYLGFSLDDIKTRLPSINTPEEVSTALTEQAKGIREKIESLTNVLESVEKLNAEVVLMEAVDWKKYADIVALLYLKNDGYWVMKYFKDDTMEQFRTKFDNEIGLEMTEKYKLIIKKSVQTQNEGNSPESEQGQSLAKEWWDFVMEFTKGDISLLSELIKMGGSLSDSEWEDKFLFSKDFLERALKCYLASIEYDTSKLGEENI